MTQVRDEYRTDYDEARGGMGGRAEMEREGGRRPRYFEGMVSDKMT